MKDKDIFTIVVIVVILVASISLLGLRLRGPEAIEEGIGEVFDLGDIFGRKNEVALALTIIYHDGSEKTIDATPLQMTRLTITDDTGKEVKEVRCNVKVRVDWTGTYRSQRTAGNIKLYVNDVLKNTKSFTYTMDLPKGSWAAIANVIYTNAGLEAWLKDGQNNLRVIAPLTVAITFADGSTDSMSGQGGVVFTLNKASDTGKITVVEVAVTRTLIR